MNLGTNVHSNVTLLACIFLVFSFTHYSPVIVKSPKVGANFKQNY